MKDKPRARVNPTKAQEVTQNTTQPSKASSKRGGKRTKLAPATVDKILDYSTTPGLSNVDIGRLVSVDHSTVSKILKQYNVDRQLTQEYIDNEVMILQGLKSRLLKSITDAAIQNVSPAQRVTMFAILEDKLYQRANGGGKSAIAIQVNINHDPRIMPEVTINDSNDINTLQAELT
jgi:hypothetical protein